MKKLFIIRHSKSDWGDENLDDFDRPLNEKGIKDCALVGKYLKQKNEKIDIILSSPALRAHTTAKLLAKELDFNKNIMQNQYIYEPFVAAIQELISYIHDDNDTAILVGHNPGVSTLAYMLCDSREELKTASIVEISFSCDSWMDVNKNNATFISYTKPKDL
ncbi:MAG: histidine phosphatase family protein [Campylobacteraceae bacterium]|nr:histidine phosphatase family protein [Campylobacteraceae bacterium]